MGLDFVSFEANGLAITDATQKAVVLLRISWEACIDRMCSVPSEQLKWNTWEGADDV